MRLVRWKEMRDSLNAYRTSGSGRAILSLLVGPKSRIFRCWDLKSGRRENCFFRSQFYEINTGIDGVRTDR